MTKPLSLSALAQVADKATQDEWFVVGQPWLPRDCETYVISGSPDPHAGTMICDMPTADMAGVEDRYDDGEWSARNDLNAAHISTFDPPTVKRLLAIAEAARALEALCKTVAFRDTAQLDVRITPQFDRLSAALDGITE